MQSLEQLRRELEARGKSAQLKALAESADGQRLGQMIDARALEDAARTQDTAALQKMLGQVLSTDEGKRLAASVKEMLAGKD